MLNLERWKEGKKRSRIYEFGTMEARNRSKERRKEEMLNLGIWNDGRKEKRGLEFTNLER